MNPYRLMEYFMFWICYCEDPIHHGDNPDCPRHGLRPFVVRFIAFLGLAILVFMALLIYKKGV